MILSVDAASQTALGAVVAEFEKAIQAAGIPVVPRSQMEGFHLTIGTVSSAFPMDEALNAINTAIPKWSDAPIPMQKFEFFMPPHVVKSTP